MHFFEYVTLGEIIQADSQSYQSSSLTRGTAGKQRGQDDHRSGVLKHVLKYIETKAPTTFVLENVPGLRGRKHRLPDLPFISFTLVIWSFHWLIDLKYWIYCGLNSLDLTWTPTLKTLVASLRKALQGLDEPAPQHEGGEWQATLPCCVEGHGMHWMTIISQRFWWVNLSKSIQIINQSDILTSQLRIHLIKICHRRRHWRNLRWWIRRNLGCLSAAGDYTFLEPHEVERCLSWKATCCRRRRRRWPSSRTFWVLARRSRVRAAWVA